MGFWDFILGERREASPRDPVATEGVETEATRESKTRAAREAELQTGAERAMAPARGYAQTVEREQRKALDFGEKALRSGPLVTAGERMKVEEAFGRSSLQHLTRAAETGTMHSGSLGYARRELAQRKALAAAALEAEEERRQRERLLQLEQLQAATRAGREGTAAWISREAAPDKESGRRPVVNLTGVQPYMDRFQKTDEQIQRIVTELDRRRPSEEQMRQSVHQGIDEVYSSLKNKYIAEARRLGMSDAYVEGLAASFDNDKDRMKLQSEEMIASAMSPDPQARLSFLQSMYAPEKFELAQDVFKDPALALLIPAGGVLGAFVGGFATKSPMGAMAGYQVGSSLGEAAYNMG